jgi:hypothetical protein
MVFFALLALASCVRAAPSPPASPASVVVPREERAAQAPDSELDAVRALSQSSASSLPELWLRRLASAWLVAQDPRAPEVMHAANELWRTTRWSTLGEEVTILERLAPLAPVFEVSTLPVADLDPKNSSSDQSWKDALLHANAARRPAQVAIYKKLGAQGRRNILARVSDESTLAELFAISARDGVCPAVEDDRDLRWAAYGSPAASVCAPAPLPEDELHDLDKLSEELIGPWPRAVRAMAALRALRNKSGPLRASLEQQERFLRACLRQPTCPLWLLDGVDPALRPSFEEAKKTATPVQRDQLERALSLRQKSGHAGARDPADVERAADECVEATAKALAGGGSEPWMREARAAKLRDECLPGADLGRQALEKLAAKADVETCAILLRKMIEGGARLPQADLERVAADVRTRVDLFRALAAAKRVREMPAAWATSDALIESQGVVAVVRDFGAIPEIIEREPPSMITYEGHQVVVAYLRLRSLGEYAHVAPVHVAVGPMSAGAAYRGERDLSGTDWGTYPGGLRAFVEQHATDARSVGLFENFLW